MRTSACWRTSAARCWQARHEDFRLLADFGGAVLAGQERENGQGYQFVTWIWDYDRTGVSHGHYYEDNFQSAKQDFAVRSGLIPRAQLFTPEELTELYRAAEHWFYEGPELDYKQQKAIQEARTKIEYTVPDLQSRLEQAQRPSGRIRPPLFCFQSRKSKWRRCSVWTPKI